MAFYLSSSSLDVRLQCSGCSSKCSRRAAASERKRGRSKVVASESAVTPPSRLSATHLAILLLKISTKKRTKILKPHTITPHKYPPSHLPLWSFIALFLSTMSSGFGSPTKYYLQIVRVLWFHLKHKLFWSPAQPGKGNQGISRGQEVPCSRPVGLSNTFPIWQS